jgi:hypothetical protein
LSPPPLTPRWFSMHILFDSKAAIKPAEAEQDGWGVSWISAPTSRTNINGSSQWQGAGGGKVQADTSVAGGVSRLVSSIIIAANNSTGASRLLFVWGGGSFVSHSSATPWFRTYLTPADGPATHLFRKSKPLLPTWQVIYVVAPKDPQPLPPTNMPTASPTFLRTGAPSAPSTFQPTLRLTHALTQLPTPSPTSLPTVRPTLVPTSPSIPTAVAPAIRESASSRGHSLPLTHAITRSQPLPTMNMSCSTLATLVFAVVCAAVFQCKRFNSSNRGETEGELQEVTPRRASRASLQASHQSSRRAAAESAPLLSATPEQAVQQRQRDMEQRRQERERRQREREGREAEEHAAGLDCMA